MTNSINNNLCKLYLLIIFTKFQLIQSIYDFGRSKIPFMYFFFSDSKILWIFCLFLFNFLSDGFIEKLKKKIMMEILKLECTIRINYKRNSVLAFWPKKSWNMAIKDWQLLTSVACCHYYSQSYLHQLVVPSTYRFICISGINWNAIWWINKLIWGGSMFDSLKLTDLVN